MTNAINRLSNLRRPSLLLKAARLGLSNYCRDRDLTRLTGEPNIGGNGDLFAQLFEEEDYMEIKRKTGDAGYSIARHIAVLIALLSEASHITPSID